MAFGRLAGSLVAVIYWIETPVWIGGSLAITGIAVVDKMIVPVEGPWRLAFAFAFVWLTIGLAVAPLRIGKWIPATCAVVQVVLLLFFTITVAIYAAEHGVHGVGAGDLAPSWAVFILAAPVLVYNFIGFELPSTAAEEMRDPQRDIPAAIARAGALTAVLYCIPIVAIVLVLPADEITSLTGFIDALASVFVVYGPAAGVLGGRPRRRSSGCSSRTGSPGSSARRGHRWPRASTGRRRVRSARSRRAPARRCGRRWCPAPSRR